MLVLGIETSCDETGVALYDGAKGITAEALHSQVQLHAEYGGVVPELASRDHIKRISTLVSRVMGEACIDFAALEGIAYTAGPGLAGALMVGAGFGRSLAFALGIPAIAVHHMEGHLLAPLLSSQHPKTNIPEPQELNMPFVALLVSGGHTQLVQANAHGSYQLLGESVDDAAGEAFDKVAKMLGLSYPGGPEIARIAESGNNNRFRFPRPMTDRPGLDFSFSGLKTFARNCIENHSNTNKQNPDERERVLGDQDRADIACAFEDAVVDTLYIKCRRALQQTGLSQLVIAGGVSANTKLRHTLKEKLEAQVFYAPQHLCTDNGAMIAFAGHQRLITGQSEALEIKVQARWDMTSLQPIV